MTEQMIRGRSVVRPVPDRITSTILDHATVVTDEGSFGLRNNMGMWPSYNCLDLLTPTAMCPDPHVGSKTFKQSEWATAFEFAVYGGVHCLAVGLDKADQQAETRRVFERSEAKGVEQALLYTRFQAASEPLGSDDPLTPSHADWDEPEFLNPLASIPVHVALSLLEGHAAANYAGLPTIHIPRAAGTLLEALGLIVWEGDKAFTKNGSKVAMGGGYDDPSYIATGKMSLYATGEVYVEKSAQIDQQVYVIPGDGSGTGSDQNGLSDNTVVSFAERMYRVALDCYAARADARVFTVSD